MKKKLFFYPAVDNSHDSAIKGALAVTLEAAPKGTLNNIHKDAQESAFEIAMRMHLRLHLSCTSGGTC